MLQGLVVCLVLVGLPVAGVGDPCLGGMDQPIGTRTVDGFQRVGERGDDRHLGELVDSELDLIARADAIRAGCGLFLGRDGGEKDRCHEDDRQQSHPERLSQMR